MPNDPTVGAEGQIAFLATTAIEEFWDKRRPMVLLGRWCQRADQRSLSNATLMPSPYGNDQALQQANQRVTMVYERVLPILAERLNALHGKGLVDRSWRIIIGPWLQLYVASTFDRYLHIKYAQELHPGFTTLTMASASFIVPRDTLDFACSISEDTCNLQMITKILCAMGLSFPSREALTSRNALYVKLSGTSWKHRAVGLALRLYARICAIAGKGVLLRHPYFLRSIEAKLAIINPGRVLPVWEQAFGRCASEVDHVKRQSILELNFGEDEFDRCLASMMPNDLPMSFIENFEAIGRAALHTYPRRVNAVFSANAWYYDEVFKRAAAGLSEQGAQLLGTQHGGNYGALQHMPSEDHETAIVDRYFSWGWGRSDCAAEVVPMPAGKLMGRELLGADNGAEGILWVATSAPRYLTQYPFLPEYFHDYLGWQQRFAIGLPGRLLDVMRFRPHYEDYGWGIVDRLQTHVPMLKVESWQRPFSESLRDCRLYVCDHLSTTFIEALAVNKPTILFWDPCVNRLRPEAQPYYDLLYSAGILFDTPEGAIKAIGEAYDDVESWWSAADRQHAVGEFCRRFAFTAPDALRLWSLALSNAQARPALAKSPLR